MAKDSVPLSRSLRSISPAPQTEEPDSPTKIKRVNINLPDSLFQELQQLSTRTGRSMTDILRFGLGLAVIAYTQTGPGRKLTISDENDQAVKEILIPR